MKRLRRKTIRKAGMAVGCLAVVLIYILACAGSWIMTCGVFKLVTLCFGWEYTWGVATGIWLIIFLAKQVFSSCEIKDRR